MDGLRQLACLVSDPPPTSAAELELAGMALVDFAGVALAGTTEPVAGIIAGFCSAGGQGPAEVIGMAMRAGPCDAAFANGTIGHALDYDDSNMVLGGHPTVPILPALLAIGQQTRASGHAILEAYAVGFEVMLRLARAVNFEHYERGWHPTATLGVFGAAAGVARLLCLTEKQAGHALGLAASMASGVKANFGAMAKPIQVGYAASKGAMSALLARSGATASADALEGERGFLSVYNGKGAYRAEALAGSGKPEILVSGIKFKRYPCCGSTHVVIDAVKRLRAEHAVEAERIEAVEVLINPRRRPHVDRPVVAAPLEGKFSVQYTAAAALADGDVGLGHFSEATIARPDLQMLLKKVRVGGLAEGAAELGQPCRLTVTLAEGEKYSVFLGGPAGRDASEYRQAMRGKFVDCATLVTDPATAESLLQELLRFSELDDINPLMGRLSLRHGRQFRHAQGA